MRVLIPDTQSPGIFSDDEINAFMQINQLTWQSSMYYSGAAGSRLPSAPTNFLRAAALALNTLAGNSSRLAVVGQLLDVKLQADKAADGLQKRAEFYLRMDDESGAFAIAEQVNTVWAFRDRWIAQLQRQSGGAGLP